MTAQDYLRFRIAGWLAGRLMLYSARFALRVGDRVEFDAIRAAIKAGNTGDRRTPASAAKQEPA